MRKKGTSDHKSDVPFFIPETPEAPSTISIKLPSMSDACLRRPPPAKKILQRNPFIGQEMKEPTVFTSKGDGILIHQMIRRKQNLSLWYMYAPVSFFPNQIRGEIIRNKTKIDLCHFKIRSITGCHLDTDIFSFSLLHICEQLRLKIKSHRHLLLPERSFVR